MDNRFKNINKLILIGISVVSTKLVLILFAYFFNAETYNTFNQVYYTASIIILFGSLGFNIAITRVKLSIRLVAAASFINILITWLILYTISEPFVLLTENLAVITYAFFSSMAGIYVFHLLFNGKYKEYVLLTLLYSVLHILIIPFVMYVSSNLFYILPFVSMIWFLIGFNKYLRDEGSSIQVFKEFYKIGITAFIINSAVSLALAADKYIVNHFFPMDIANSYTFAWGLTAPMFYIGVIVEKFLFSETNTSRVNILRRGFLLTTSVVLIYAALILFIIYFFPGLIPSSVNYKLVIEITTLMITGYSLYIIFHFPVNAYLFKSMGTDKQKIIAASFTIIISAFLILYILILRNVIIVNYISLLIVTWSFIFILLITKIFLMFKEEIGTEPEKVVMEIQNLEP